MKDSAAASASAASWRAEIVSERDALLLLETEWRRLAVSRGNAFVTPEWYLLWLRRYGDAAAPFVPVVRDADGALKGLLPLVVARTGRRRSLQFGGGTVGDCFHPVAAETDEEAVAAAAGLALAQAGREWSLAVLHNVGAGAAWVGKLLQGSSRRLTPTWDAPQRLPYVPLEGLTWEAFLAARSSSLRKALAYELRRLERTHTVAFRLAGVDSDLTTDLDAFFRLHDLRWEGRGGSSLASPRARAFLADFAAAAREAAWLRLWFLEVDGHPVASWLGWRLGCRYAFFQSGFDPAFARHSPGLLIVAHTIRAAIEEGAAEYDMLLGDEAYKTRFAPEQRAVSTVVLAPALRASRAVAVFDIGLRRLGRRLPGPARRRVRALAGPLLRRLPSSRHR